MNFNINIMKKSTFIIAILVTNLLGITLNAQPKTIKLWPEGIPGSITGGDYKEV